MPLIHKLFTEHPASVGESYFQHFAAATGFGLRMIWGGLVCIAHAFVPGVCCRKGSEMVEGLHQEMVENRRRRAEQGYDSGHARAA